MITLITREEFFKALRATDLHSLGLLREITDLLYHGTVPENALAYTKAGEPSGYVWDFEAAKNLKFCQAVWAISPVDTALLGVGLMQGLDPSENWFIGVHVRLNMRTDLIMSKDYRFIGNMILPIENHKGDTYIPTTKFYRNRKSMLDLVAENHHRMLPMGDEARFNSWLTLPV